MPALDLAMPTALFIVVTVALLLNRRVGDKLMKTVEQKEFKTRDVILLAVFILVVISVIAYTSIVNPGGLTSNVLLVLFMSSYTMLLFTFSYVFTNITKVKAQVISLGFGSISLAAGIASFLGPISDSIAVYRAAAFFVLAACCYGAAVYEQTRNFTKARWHIAAQPPALFVLLFVFFNFLYGGTTSLWFPVLMDVFGFTFAILIILYLSSLFNWKTVTIFAVLLTLVDIFLVIGTGTMVTAARQFTGLGLPVLVYVPNVPFIYSPEGILLNRGLGLGDFFFAGILAVQTYNKFGRKTALISAVAMAVAFGIWEAYLGEILRFLEPIMGREIGGFPGTLMIISGWIPVVAYKLLTAKKAAASSHVAESAPVVDAPAESSLPVQ